MQPAAPDLYLNMQQFSDLKLQARQHSADATRAVAEQFEGLFVQMMLKNMRAAAKLDDSQHSSSMDFYTDMYDKQLALVLSRQGGIGIADLLQQQLPGGDAGRQEPAPATGLNLPIYRVPLQQSSALPIANMNYRAENPSVRTHPLQEPVSHVSNNQAAALRSQQIEPFSGWPSAQRFVADLWPHAERAARQLGVSAQVLVAQSALETGWGKHAMRKPDGSVAFNLFGIKAGHDWGGQSVLQPTLEYRDGSMQKESASFRAYDSVADSLDDYVAFIQNRARYQSALQHDGDDEHYVRGLQSAGYATDPAYADKILGIMQGDTFREALAGLSPSQTEMS